MMSVTQHQTLPSKDNQGPRTVGSDQLSTRIESTLQDAESLLQQANQPATVVLSVVIPVYNEPVTVLEIVARRSSAADIQTDHRG